MKMDNRYIHFVVIGICLISLVLTSCVLHNSWSLGCDMDLQDVRSSDSVRISIYTFAPEGKRRETYFRKNVTYNTDSSWGTASDDVYKLLNSLCIACTDDMLNSPEDAEVTGNRKTQKKRFAELFGESSASIWIRTYAPNSIPFIIVGVTPGYINVYSSVHNPPNFLLIFPVSQSYVRGIGFRYSDDIMFPSRKGYIVTLQWLEKHMYMQGSEPIEPVHLAELWSRALPLAADSALVAEKVRYWSTR